MKKAIVCCLLRLLCIFQELGMPRKAIMCCQHARQAQPDYAMAFGETPFSLCRVPHRLRERKFDILYGVEQFSLLEMFLRSSWVLYTMNKEILKWQYLTTGELLPVMLNASRHIAICYLAHKIHILILTFCFSILILCALKNVAYRVML